MGKALLRRGDLTVTEVCFAVGCTSLGSFSSRFTELVGESPSSYRARRHGEGGLEVRNDIEFEGMRWVTVGAPSQPDVDIVLEPPVADPNASPLLRAVSRWSVPYATPPVTVAIWSFADESSYTHSPTD